MSTFVLPDLGEGLPEAEIVSWHVKEGDMIVVDQPLLSVETAKAVVEVPSPQSGRIAKLYAGEGDIVATGKPLVDFTGDSPTQAAPAAKEEPATGSDSGTVVGSMPTSNKVLVETAIAGRARRNKSGRVKATPAVRALARRLNVDLTQITPTGRHGQVTATDVEGQTQSAFAPTPRETPAAPIPPEGKQEPVRGPRRAMALTMSAARDAIANCTLFDDADIHNWRPGEDITTRVVRAIAAGCLGEPGLNAWFDADNMTRQIHGQVDLAMAVDTPDGLIVPVLRDAGKMTALELRDALNTLKKSTRERTVTPADMRNPTITLSNFGMLAGRYATPVIVPPMVAILGTGGIRHDVVAVMGGIEVHRRIPLSLTFDHRAATGGEACRFLAAVIGDLARAD